MAHRPRVLAFDIIETTFSLETLRPRLSKRGLPASVLDLWFAHTFRDAFTLAATGVYAPFTEVAIGPLRALCVAHGVRPDPEQDSGPGVPDHRQGAHRQQRCWIGARSTGWQGIMVVRELVTRLNGEVHVHAGENGGGATVTVRLHG